MKNSISIFSVLVLMSALITTSGCNLKAELDDLLGSIPKDIPGVELNVTSNPSPLVSSGNLVSEIRGNGNDKTPGFVITSITSNKYVNVALVKVGSSASTVYLNSVASSTSIHHIEKGAPSNNKLVGEWNVATTPATETYYIYIWLTKEQYTAIPYISDVGTDPTTIFNALTKDKTVLEVATSGDNKYYATGK